MIDTDNKVIYGLKEHITEDEMRSQYLTLNGYGSLVFEYAVYLGTGTTVKLYNSLDQEVDSYTVIIYGDVDGDGIISPQDVGAVKGHISGASPISPDTPEFAAADMDDDGEITMQDAILMKAVMSGAQVYDQANKTLEN